MSKDLQALEFDELKLKQRRLEMEARMKLAALTDEEKALTKKSVVHNLVKTAPFVTAPPSIAVVSEEHSSSDKEVTLNPHSPVFVPTSMKVDVMPSSAADKYVSKLAVQD